MKILLTIASEGKKEFEIPEQNAYELNSIIYDKSVSGETMIRIDDNTSYKKRAINGIRLIREEKIETGESKSDREWREYKERVLAMPPEERWKECDKKFKLFHKLYKGKEATEKVMEIFKTRAIKFFQDNPKYISVDYNFLIACFGDTKEDFIQNVSMKNEWKLKSETLNGMKPVEYRVLKLVMEAECK